MIHINSILAMAQLKKDAKYSVSYVYPHPITEITDFSYPHDNYTPIEAILLRYKLFTHNRKRIPNKLQTIIDLLKSNYPELFI